MVLKSSYMLTGCRIILGSVLNPVNWQNNANESWIVIFCNQKVCALGSRGQL